MVCLGNDWDNLLADEFKKDYYLSLREFLKSEYFSRSIYPPMNDIYMLIETLVMCTLKILTLKL